MDSLTIRASNYIAVLLLELTSSLPKILTTPSIGLALAPFRQSVTLFEPDLSGGSI